MVQNLTGNWKAGWALDLHTISSIMRPDGSFENQYTDIGHSLHLFKYRQQYSEIDFLSNKLIDFLQTRLVTPYLDVVLPVPPSKLDRDYQPVFELVSRLSNLNNKITIDYNFLQKQPIDKELKAIQNLDEREDALKNTITLSEDLRYKNKKILLVDDLYRSGTTLKECTRVLHDIGQVQNVYIVTLTKTRVHR